MEESMCNKRAGQSLVELLIALGLMATVTLTAMGIMQFLARLSAQDPVAQTASFIAKSDLDAVTALAEGSWNAIASIPANTNYHVEPAGGGFRAAAGEAVKTVNNVAYTSFFTVEPVYRDAAGAIADTGTPDAGTKKITETVSWTHQGGAQTHTLAQYVARTQNEVAAQTDWVAGATCPGSDSAVPAHIMPTHFCAVTSGALDYAGTPGSVTIQGY
jgi:hypothetical protein